MWRVVIDIKHQRFGRIGQALALFSSNKVTCLFSTQAKILLFEVRRAFNKSRV